MTHIFVRRYRRSTSAAAALTIMCAPIACSAALAATDIQCGKASWYALHGQTASGEMADPTRLAAAHRSLPFGSLVTVTNLTNGKAVAVRINDRGPFVKGRVIDVTKAAAQRLDFISNGITTVAVTGPEAEDLDLHDLVEACAR